jgi:hypothetical protein
MPHELGAINNHEMERYKKMRKTLSLLLLVGIAAVCLASTAQAAWLVQQIPGNVINVTAGTTFTTTFGASEAAFLGEVYAVTGKSNNTSPGGSYTVPVEWSAGQLSLNDWNWQFGEVVYHFHTSGDFAGSTATINAGYINAQTGCTRDAIGVSTTAPAINTTWGGCSWTFSASEAMWGNGPGLDHYGYMARNIVLNLPAGQDIYIGVQGGAATSDKLYLNSISVTAPQTVPEPGSILALGSGLLGLVGFVARKRR